MLFINLTTIYRGRIPTLNNTQHYAEILSRSHLKYVLTGEIDTYETCLVQELTNQAHRTVRTSHPRKKHTKNATTPPRPIPPHLHLPYHSLHAKERTHPPIPRPRTTPLPTLKHSIHIKKPVDKMQPTHSTTHHPKLMHPPPTKKPTYNHH